MTKSKPYDDGHDDDKPCESCETVCSWLTGCKRYICDACVFKTNHLENCDACWEHVDLKTLKPPIIN